MSMSLIYFSPSENNNIDGEWLVLSLIWRFLIIYQNIYKNTPQIGLNSETLH